MSSFAKHELTKDERAVVYNHVLEIRSQIPGMGPINVVVEKSASGVFQVSFSTTDKTNLESIGTGESVFEASLNSKNSMNKKLQNLFLAQPSSMERSLQIFSILHGSTLH